MSAAGASLPPGFEALESFVSAWSIAGADKRLRARLASDEADRIAFFNAAKDLIAPGLEYLDKKSLADFDEQDQRLMHLLLSLAHISLAVEIQGDDEPHHAEGARHMRITRAPADVSPGCA
jgi:hypothetical protein